MVLPRGLRPALALIVASFALTGCGSSRPVDLVAACPATTVSFAPRTLGPALVRLRMDARPLVEHGRESYLGESHVGEQQFKVPVPESLLTILLRDAAQSALFRPVSRRAADQPFRVDFDILHASASYTAGLSSVIPVVPSSLEAVLEMRFVFTDEDGRVFLDERFSSRKEGSVSAFGGTREAAAALLGQATREVADQALSRLHASYFEFWNRYPAESRPLNAR
jgi:hypothetical protein